MKKHFSFLGFSVLLLLASCGSKGTLSHDELIDSIGNMKEHLSAYSITTDTAKAHQMLALYDLFVESYPDDSLAPVYMMSAADMNINLSNFEQAISLLDSLMVLYPGFDDIAMCQFMKGQAYEQNQQYDLAREAYTEFVTQYPNHILADDTRKMIPLIGLTPEEQLEAILGKKSN